MSDLISRSALIAEYDRVHKGEPGKARKLMENAPAVDAVPVVRCKDCRHQTEKGWCCFHGSCVERYDFCSYGERRDDG